MVDPDFPMEVVPAHISFLSDVSALSQVVGILLKWLVEHIELTHSQQALLWQLQFLADPAPVLPQERNIL